MGSGRVFHHRKPSRSAGDAEPSSFISAAKTEVIVSMVNDVNGVNAQKDNGVHNHISSLF